MTLYDGNYEIVNVNNNFEKFKYLKNKDGIDTLFYHKGDEWIALNDKNGKFFNRDDLINNVFGSHLQFEKDLGTINDGYDEDDDNINKTITTEELNTTTTLKNDLLNYEIESLLKHLGYDGDTSNVFENKFEVRFDDERSIKRLYYEVEKDEWVTLTKNNGNFYNRNTIINKFKGKQTMNNVLGIDVKENSAKKAARYLNDNLPTTSEINNVDGFELNKMVRDVLESTRNEGNVSVHTTDTSFVNADDDKINRFQQREMLAFDKEIKRIGGALKIATAKKVELTERINNIDKKLDYMKSGNYEEEEKENIRDIREALSEKKKTLNNELDARNKEIAILKDKFSNQITQIKESIKKFLDSDTKLGDRIKTLFKEQGITIVSILTALGFIIDVIVESVTGGGGGGSTTPNNSNKKSGNWVKDKLKALARLLGKLGEQFAAALPGIIGSIVSWLFNRAKEVVSFIAEHTWTFIVLLGGILLVFVRDLILTLSQAGAFLPAGVFRL